MECDRRAALLGGIGVAVSVVTPALADEPGLVVQTASGLVQGQLVGNVRAFTGIPFGKSTAGAGRFRPPEPAAPWSGIFDATRVAATPPQTSQMPGFALPAPISEDCLQLNVWAPTTPGPHPVFVWIYGGGNSGGSSGDPMYNGAVFARDGIVFVSLNYRLGALGFLELGGLLGPKARGTANNALRDQVLALQWVQRNVAAFGGDPSRVTVGGESAGAWNVEFLMTAPAARGLFHQAVVASGGVTPYEPLEADAFAKLFVDRLGGVDQLRTAPMAHILETQGQAEKEWGVGGCYRPVITEGDIMPTLPVEALRRGFARTIPTMIGNMREESRFFYTPAMADSPTPKGTRLNITAEQVPTLIAAYEKAFPELSRAQRTWKRTTAEAFGIPMMNVADAQAANGAPVFRYIMDYPIPKGPFGDLTPHAIDLPLIFNNLESPLAKFMFGYSEADRPMAKRIHAAWTSFIRTGHPEGDLPSWPTYAAGGGNLMILSRESRVVQDADARERPIWTGIL